MVCHIRRRLSSFYNLKRFKIDMSGVGIEGQRESGKSVRDGNGKKLINDL